MTKYSYDETEAFKTGRDVWFEMRGANAAQAMVDQAAQHEMTRDLRQFLFEHCFAAVWARPMEVAGRTATRTTTSAPLEMPPEMPPAKLVA